MKSLWLPLEYKHDIYVTSLCHSHKSEHLIVKPERKLRVAFLSNQATCPPLTGQVYVTDCRFGEEAEE